MLVRYTFHFGIADVAGVVEEVELCFTQSSQDICDDETKRALPFPCHFNPDGVLADQPFLTAELILAGVGFTSHGGVEGESCLDPGKRESGLAHVDHCAAAVAPRVSPGESFDTLSDVRFSSFYWKG